MLTYALALLNQVFLVQKHVFLGYKDVKSLAYTNSEWSYNKRDLRVIAPPVC